MLVFDSSAMLAFLADEPEATVVEALLIQADEESEGEIYAHAVNLAEVFYNIMAATDVTRAEAEIQKLLSLGIRERNDMDGAFWREVARLVAIGRGLSKPQGGRGNLAFGDACGIALSNRLGAQFVTRDRTEVEPLEQAGLVNALFTQ